MYPNSKLMVPLLLAWAMLIGSHCASAEQADRDQPIHLEADSLQLDDAKQINTFVGHVQLVQGTLLIHGDKIVVTKSSDGYQHLVATGFPASFRQRMEASAEYAEGYGETVEYDTRTDIVEFFKNARVKRGQDEVLGDHITYSSKTEIFEASGKAVGAGKPVATKDRVRAVIQPKQNKAEAGNEKTTVGAAAQAKPALDPTPPK